MRQSIFKQCNIPWVGALIESIYNSLPFLSIVLTITNFFSIIVVLYASIQPYLVNTMPWIKLETFIGGVVMIMVILMAIIVLLVYKYVTPSLWTFRNKQMNKYDSEVLNKLEELQKQIRELKGE